MSLEKRYQVFISSTFTDLKDERQAVLRADLELNHMPAGMELFPAADDAAWDLIKDVIDASDYYVLIIGGRYGSLDEAGLGYTEKEYDYAISTGKPVIPLLHENPDKLPRKKTETDPAAWKRLQALREKVEQKHTCKYWNSAEDLKTSTILGLTSTVKRHSAVGWIRADQVPSEATLAELVNLQRRVAELEAELEATGTGPPPGTEDLKQGDDTFDIDVEFTARPRTQIKAMALLNEEEYTATISPTWTQIFAGVAPALMEELSQRRLRDTLEDVFRPLTQIHFGADEDFQNKRLGGFRFRGDQIDTCLLQLHALGLIQRSERKRSFSDTRIYWTLTRYGHQQMVQLRAQYRQT